MERGSYAREVKRQALRAALVAEWRRLKRDVLSEREALVLNLRVGLSGGPLTQEATARRLGLAVGSIAPNEKRALAKTTAALNLEGHDQVS